MVTLASTGVQSVGIAHDVAKVSHTETTQSDTSEVQKQIPLVGGLKVDLDSAKDVVNENGLQVDATYGNVDTPPASNEQQADETVIATANNYVNIRDKAGMDGNIIGKLYQNSVGTLQEETPDGWYRIKSGSVDGYVKAEYVLRGEQAKVLAAQVGERLATVHTTTLRVRMEPSTNAKILTLVPNGDTLAVTNETDGWIKVVTEAGEGYVSSEYVTVFTKNVEAESIQEEQARLAKEEQERQLAQKAAEQELAKAKAATNEKATVRAKTSAITVSNKTKASGAVTQNADSAPSKVISANSSQHEVAAAQSVAVQTPVASSIGRQIADYGLQFVGNPYVYGGTSLTNGADCSGFVMSVYQHFGISLPRTSGEQGRCGSAVAGIANAAPGDLIWYSGHIGIYIGNGQIVHASNAKDGIKVSSATCMKILSIRRIV
jgi:cell wall-associated NlpC family hydrolase